MPGMALILGANPHALAAMPVVLGHPVAGCGQFGFFHHSVLYPIWPFLVNQVQHLQSILTIIGMAFQATTNINRRSVARPAAIFVLFTRYDFLRIVDEG